jgi:hypothetical protein
MKQVMFIHGVLGPFMAEWNPEEGESARRVEIGNGRAIVLRDDTPEWIGARFEADVLDVFGNVVGTAKCHTV